MAALAALRAPTLARAGRPNTCECACSTSRLSSAARGAGAPAAMQVLRPASAQQPRRPVAARGIPVSGPGVNSASGGVEGQVTSELMVSMRNKIAEALETDTVSVTDMYGDGRHVSIDVVSKLFKEKNSMQRQRMVYKAIWMELQEAVHAVDSMSTKTPEEAGAV